MEIDPDLQLFFRVFGTYHLQASFFFIMLAHKLGTLADEQVMKVCEINLKALMIFARTARAEYQVHAPLMALMARRNLPKFWPRFWRVVSRGNKLIWGIIPPFESIGGYLDTPGL
jgi:hypothetical protein